MQQKIKRLQAQLGDLKCKSKDTSYASDTLNPLSQKLENENVELEFQDNKRGTSTNTKFAKQSIMENLPKVDEIHALSKPVTSNSVPTPQESKVVKNDKQCLISVNHDVCLRNYVNGKTSRGKKCKANVSIKEKQKKHQPHVKKPKKVGFIERLATPKPRKPRFHLRWSPTGRLFDQKGKIVDSNESESQSDCSNGDNACTSNTLEPKIKRNLKLLINFVWKFMGTVRFGNDHVAAILGQFCDSNLEVAFRRNACFVRNLEGVDLLKGLPKFKYNKEHLCPSCEQGKRKRASHPPKPVLNSRQRLQLLHMDLCGPMRIASINGKRKPDISFLHVFEALCYPKNDREDIGKLGAKGDIGFFIGYSADSCAYKIYKRRTKKIIEIMNVSFDELSAIAFEQRSSKPGLQSELDLLFEVMYDDYIGGQPSAAARTVLPAQEPQVQQQGNQAHLQYSYVADNVLNALFDGNTFVNPFAIPSTSTAESSSLYNVDPSNMHTFYQPYPHEFQWSKDHPLEQVIGEPSRPVLTRNQLRSDGDMCMYALTVSNMEPKNVKEAMTDPAWIDSMQEDIL
nr:hypothetical protein [Tanacetum cinerariifolium]